MGNGGAPASRSRLEALRSAAAFALAVAAAVVLASVLARVARSSAELAVVGGSAAVPAAAWGGVFGLLRTPRARLVALWVVPPFVVVAGALFVHVLLWPQADHGGLATAAVGFLTLVVAVVTGGVALLCTLLRRAPPRKQLAALVAAGAAMALLAAVQVWATPSADDEGWIRLPSDLADARPPPRAAPPAPDVRPRATRPGAGRSPLAASTLDAEVEADCRKGEPPLFRAVRGGDVRRVRALLAANVSANLRCDYGEGSPRYPLPTALAASNVAIASALLDAGADPNRAGSDVPPLALAVAIGDEPLVRRLLDEGADRDGSDPTGLPPAGLAARAGRGEIARLLLDAGARDATWAVRGALEGGHLELARELATRGVNAEHHVEACTVLALAAGTGDVSLVQAVLAGNARVREACVREALEAAWSATHADGAVVRFLEGL